MSAYDPHLHDDRLTCFLDDSALDAKDQDHCALGGVAFNPSGLAAFEERWTDLMHRFGVEQPFHMRDLSDGQRLSHIRGCRRWCLLWEITDAIKCFNLYTVAIWANNRQHESIFSERLQKAMRVYRVAFMGVIVANVKAAKAVNYKGRVAYVLDKGTRYVEQVKDTYRAIQESVEVDQRPDTFRVASLTFESDTFSTHLQAADVVAWTRRRMAAGKPLAEDFEVLTQLFAENHTEGEMTPQMWRELDARFSPRLTDEGWSLNPPD